MLWLNVVRTERSGRDDEVEVEGEATRRGRMRLAMVLLARRRAGAFMALVRVLTCLFWVGDG
jgi:hypothetical protein